MPFGLTYAGFVVGVGLSMLFGPGDTAPQSTRNALTFGTAVQPWVTPGSETILTLSHRRQGMLWDKFTPIYALGVSNKGMSFVSVGLGRPLDIAGIKVMPHFGPVVFSDKYGNDALQFRSGFDISQTLGEHISITGGYYHISNGQNNVASADIDVAHLGILMKF